MPEGKSQETAKRSLDAMRVTMLVLTLVNILLVVSQAWLQLLVLFLSIETIGLVYYRKLILESADHQSE